MNQNFIALDIETAKPFPSGDDWREHRPLGIACAVTTSAINGTKPWHGHNPDGSPADQMTREEVKELVDYLNAQSLFGTIVTWNGMGFDWPVLAEESGQPDTCRELARNHVDMMYHLFCTKGFPLGLNSAAAGMNVGAKTEGMSGATAPEMWTDGKRQEVIDYCIRDTKLTLDLANACQADHGLTWIARSGKTNRLQLPKGWLTVENAKLIPEPDTAWMSDPLERSTLVPASPGFLNRLIESPSARRRLGHRLD